MNIQETIKEMKEFTEELKKDPEKARKFLVDAGIYDENGNLTENYKEE